MPDSPRPADAALLREADWVLNMTIHSDRAELMPASMSHIKASDFAAQAKDLIGRLRARLSETREAGEDRKPRASLGTCTAMAKGRRRCTAPATKVYLSSRVGQKPAKLMRCDEHPLGNAMAWATIEQGGQHG